MSQGLSPVPPRQMSRPLIPQDVPVYRVLDEKGFFVDDTLFPQDTIIEWPDAINPMLEPMNELAHQKMSEYLADLDKCGQEWARREKKHYVSQLDTYLRSRETVEDVDDGRRARTIGEKREVPAMGAHRSRPPRAKSVDLSSAEAAPRVVKAKGKFSLEKSAKDKVNALSDA